MRTIRFIIITLLLALSQRIIAQASVAGKTFTAQTGSTCKDMKNGGCTINTFCMLKFSKDNVEVTDYTKANCSDKKLEKNYERNRSVKTYKWSQQKNTIHIEGFDDYGSFTLNGNDLSGAKKEGDAYEMVVFKAK